MAWEERPALQPSQAVRADNRGQACYLPASLWVDGLAHEGVGRLKSVIADLRAAPRADLAMLMIAVGEIGAVS